VGARTLDTLIALVARPNEAIRKRELMAIVWPGVTVEEGSLCVQIAALRKALGDGQGGARTSRRSPDEATASSRRFGGTRSRR
jgi:DNA-binding winged helix-turn-helix (wHTH) protein